MAAADPSALGREYSCGVSNVGVADILPLNSIDINDELRPKEVYYGTSHARNGVLCQLSCQTMNGELFGCLQFPEPILTRVESDFLKRRIECFLSVLSK